MVHTVYGPGEVWKRGEHDPLPRTYNSRHELFSIDGSLAVDGVETTFWDVNPNGL